MKNANVKMGWVINPAKLCAENDQKLASNHEARTGTLRPTESEKVPPRYHGGPDEKSRVNRLG